MFQYARAVMFFVLALAPIFPTLLTVPSAEAAESTSTNFRNTRSDVNAGGSRKTSASFREDSTMGALALTTATSTAYLARDGMQSVYHYPFGVTDLFASSATASTEIYLQWTSPGNDGSEASTPGLYIVRYSSIAADSPAISDAKFNAATAVAPAPPASQPKGTLVSMNVTGLTAGVTYYFAIKTAERDGTRSRLSAGATTQTLAPNGCAVVRNVHKLNGPYTTIQSAVDSLPTTLPGHTCVIVRDSATYPEQVSVRNFVNNNSSITIYSAGAAPPVIAPPAGSTAAFVVENSSVNLTGLVMAPGADVAYGVYTSSSYVAISSVVVTTAAGAGTAKIWNAAVYLGGSWNTIAYSSITVGDAIGIHVRADWAAVSYTTAAVGSNAFSALSIASASSATVSNGYFANGGQSTAVRVSGTSEYNTITRSSIAVNAVGVYGLIVDSPYNTVTRSVISNPLGQSVLLGTTGAHNVISLSTISSGGDIGLVIDGASNTVTGSNIYGSTAVYVRGSTGTMITSSRLQAMAGAGAALSAGNGIVNLTVASSTLLGGASGVGFDLQAGGRGAVSIGSVTVSGASRGVRVSTQGAGFELAVDSITFRGLASGATAIHFLGGTFVSTVTLAYFEDANIGANVSGATLDLASRITMRSFVGARAGPTYENDPNSLVDWADFMSPYNVALWYVGVSSAGLTFNTVGADGYLVQASTNSDFSGGVTVSSTVFGTQDRLSVTPLMPNTTYYLRAGALWSGTSVYAQTVVSTATLSQLVTGTTVYNIHLTSMVVNWHPLALAPPDASSMSAQGYVLQASSMSSFTPLWSSSATSNVALSTLTIESLRGGVTYYFRVGSLNHNNVPNFAGAVSTLMPVQLGVELTTHTISVPGLVNMNTSVLITTSVVVTNTGNVRETYWVRATTLTVGSPWRIGATQGSDQYSLSMIVNGVEPALGDFSAEDRIADAETICSGLVYAFGGNCVQVPVGGTRTLWFRLDTPLATSTVVPQDIRIFARAVRDPDPDPNP